ncbi:MAG: hypothetical protein JNN11_04375 [Candidatus Doudnabacteria bacterium]|nr:hypothetical protein [Candidatus Doudnabacteria bacterium]
MKVIIPMAGLGTRFAKLSDQNPEYKKPKPLINVKGLPMVRWATGSLPFVEHPGQKVEGSLKVSMQDLVFVILKKHNQEFLLEQKLKEIYRDKINIVELEEVTRGAAETAYMAKSFMNLDEDVLFSDSDHYFDGKILEDLILNKGPETAGIIPVFEAVNDGVAKWSYSLTKPGSNVIEKVAEKDPELMNKGAYANIGAYYFSKAKYFLDEVESVMANNERFGEAGKGEFYIAPLYQKLLDKGMVLQAAVLPEVWGLGTPADLENFLQNCKVDKP